MPLLFRILLSGFLLLSGSWIRAIPQDYQVIFEDVSEAAGLNVSTICGTMEKKFIVEGNGSGCAWIDYDNDGWMDLYIVNGISLENLFQGETDASRAPNSLFRNNADGTFTEVTQKAGILGSGLGNGVVAADYDNDGFIDLFVTNYGEDILYRNNGNGTFTNVTGGANVGGGHWWSTGATFGDYDRDGWVDLYVSRYVDFDLQNPPTGGASCNYRGLPVMCGPLQPVAKVREATPDRQFKMTLWPWERNRPEDGSEGCGWQRRNCPGVRVIPFTSG